MYWRSSVGHIITCLMMYICWKASLKSHCIIFKNTYHIDSSARMENFWLLVRNKFSTRKICEGVLFIRSRAHSTLVFFFFFKKQLINAPIFVLVLQGNILLDGRLDAFGKNAFCLGTSLNNTPKKQKFCFRQSCCLLIVMLIWYRNFKLFRWMIRTSLIFNGKLMHNQTT